MREVCILYSTLPRLDKADGRFTTSVVRVRGGSRSYLLPEIFARWTFAAHVIGAILLRCSSIPFS